MKSTIRNLIVLTVAFLAIGVPCSAAGPERFDAEDPKASADVIGSVDTLENVLEPVDTPSGEQGDRWRKTVHGWEWLEAERPAPSFLQLHPLLVAAFQLLVAIFVWLLADESRDRALATK